jgi:uncharacterized lipoprotein YajG
MLRTLFMGAFVLAAALFYAGCSEFQPGESEFENQTGYAITVTIVGSSFSIWSADTQQFVSFSQESFSISSNGGRVRIQSSDHSVDFKWTTDSAGNNSKIYVVNDGSKVTFKE